MKRIWLWIAAVALALQVVSPVGVQVGAWGDNVTYTISPSAYPASVRMKQGAYTGYQGVSFATLRAATPATTLFDGVASASASIKAGQDNAEYHYIYRTVIQFVLPEGLTSFDDVFSVKVRGKKTQDVNTFTTSTPTWSLFSNGALTNGDGGAVVLGDWLALAPAGVSRVTSEVVGLDEFADNEYIDFPILESKWANVIHFSSGTASVVLAESTYDGNNMAPTWQLDKTMSLTLMDITLVVEAETPLGFTVQTFDPEYFTRPDKMRLGGVVLDMGDNALVLGSVEWGYTQSYGHTSVVKRVISAGSDSYVFADVLNPTPGATYHYRMKGVGDLTGVVYGVDKTASIDDSTEPDVRTLKVAGVTVSTVNVGAEVWALGGEASLALSVELNQDPTFVATGVNIPLDASVTEAVRLTKGVTALVANTTYYYRAKGIGASVTYYGATYQFRTDDPDKMPFVNQIQRGLDSVGMGGSGIWWLFLLLALVAPWIWFMPHPWVAVVLDAVLFGLFLSLRVLDLWLVLLLAIVAVGVCVLLFRRAQGGGG